MERPCRIEIDVVTDRSFKLLEKAAKGLPERELRDLSERKIKVFKDALDEANNKSYCGTKIKASPIERNDKRSITLSGSLLTETSIVATAKVKENMENI